MDITLPFNYSESVSYFIINPSEMSRYEKILTYPVDFITRHITYSDEWKGEHPVPEQSLGLKEMSQKTLVQISRSNWKLHLSEKMKIICQSFWDMAIF